MSTNERIAPGYGDCHAPDPIEHDEYEAITDALLEDDHDFADTLGCFIADANEQDWLVISTELRRVLNEGEMPVTYELLNKYLSNKK